MYYYHIYICILKISPSFRSGLESNKTNLCILDNRALKKLELSVFAQKGIYCVPILYLRNLVLAMDKKLTWSESVVPEFLPYLENMTL